MSKFSSNFNARYSTPEQIAEHFVAPPRFNEIAKFSNMILVGPRGIGKTTILKVLTASGLFHLSKKFDTTTLDVDYVPIYIPAEKMWKGNYEAIQAANFSQPLCDKILHGLFVNHCLYYLVSSIQDCISVAKLAPEHCSEAWCFDVSKEVEATICRLLSEVWDLDRIQTSFIGIKLSLTKRTNLYCSAVNALSQDDAARQLEGLSHLDILQMFRAFFDVMHEFVGADRWSLNFDEMEIAPPALIRTLFENLRSFDQRAALKFSLFPYVEFHSLLSGHGIRSDSPGSSNDFVSINLAPNFTQSHNSFSVSLIEGICEERGFTLAEIREYLNNSTAIHQNTRVFLKDSFNRDFKGMLANSIERKSDPSFMEFLSKRGINAPADIDQLSETKRAALIRKTFPIAEIRQYYLKDRPSVENGVLRRSIKGYGYYHGFDQISSLTEQNPRAIYFYFSELISQMKSGVASSTAQNKTIRQNVDRFRAFVATQAIPHHTNNGKLRNTLNVVDRIGTNLSLFLFNEIFRAEPPLSFIFKDLDETTKSIIGIAINTGAIVPEQPTDDTHLIFDLVGYRLRVSHRLAPFYPLPMITSKPKTFSRIPSDKGRVDQQPDLLSYRFEDE
ncbi:MAG: hypothetical protein ACRBBQ_02070 [Cognatishimia sp.]